MIRLVEDSVLSQLTLNDVDDRVWTKLQELAASHGHTLEAEAKGILLRALVKDETDPWAGIDAIRERLAASGRTFSDSAELIVEDRLR